MTNISTAYDVFSGTLKFEEDGRPLPGISSLSQLQKRPFSDWARRIFSITYEEINDDYAMTYVGRSCEAKVLAYFSKKNEHCRSFSTKIPVIPDSALKRLKTLHLLCQNGLMYRKISVNIPVYSDFSETDIAQLIKNALPKLCFCSFKIERLPFSQCFSQHSPFFVILSTPQKDIIDRLAKDCDVENYVIWRSSQTAFFGIEGQSFLDGSTPGDLLMVIKEKLEFQFFPLILKQILQTIHLDESHPQYFNVLALDKVEVTTIPTFPLSMEFGQKAEIKLHTIPDGASPEKLEYRVSSKDILSIHDGVMQAVGNGEVVVEAYRPGHASRIAVATIKVVRRNRITSLTAHPSSIKLCVGDQMRLSYSYEPKDADNACSIKFLSTDGTIAAATASGEITARKPGSTTVFFMTDDHVRGVCNVQVFPALEEIRLTLQSTSIRCGDYCSVEVTRIPASAILDPMILKVEPGDIAEYDAGSKIIVTKKPGKAVLKAIDRRHSVEATLPFTVRKKGLFK